MAADLSEKQLQVIGERVAARIHRRRRWRAVFNRDNFAVPFILAGPALMVAGLALISLPGACIAGGLLSVGLMMLWVRAAVDDKAGEGTETGGN